MYLEEQKQVIVKKLLGYHATGFCSKVQILTSDNSCPECKKLEGKILTIEQALSQMPIPCNNCTFELEDGKPGWCRCTYIPIVDDEKEEEKFPKTAAPIPVPVKKKGMPLWLFLVGAVAIVLLIGIIGNQPTQETSPSYNAWYACEQFILRSLKAPKTAEFESYSASNVRQVDDDEWVVSIYVDAQNGFGALIRSDFSCQVRKQDKEWWLVSLDEQ